MAAFVAIGAAIGVSTAAAAAITIGGAAAIGGLANSMSGPSAPAPTDFTGAANAQGAANLQAARQTSYLGNPNVVTPYGKQTVTWGGTPTFDQAGYDAAMANYNNTSNTPMYDEYGNFQGGSAQGAMPTREQFTSSSGNPDQATVTQTLTPDAQAALDAQLSVQKGLAQTGEKALTAVQDKMATPFQYQGPNIQTSLDLSNVAKMPVNAGMTGQNAIMARLNPQIQAQNASLAQTLANQGVTPGSEAWKTAMAAQGQTSNDLISQAALYGINLDFSANNQEYNQALSSGNFNNTASNNQYQRDTSNYYMPINTMAAIESGAQIQNPQFQSYTGGGTIGAAPIANATTAAGNFAQGQYGNDVAANNATTSGLFSIAGSAAGGAARNPSGLFGTSIPYNTNNGYF